MRQFFCAIAFVAVMLTSCQNPQGASTSAVAANDSPFSIAFVNTDTLLSKYDYAIKISEQLNSKAEDSRTNYNEKLRTFNQDLAEFQRKVQNNGFLSVERAQKEQNRLQEQERNLQILNQQLSQDLMQEQARLTTELRDTVSNFLKEYAAGKYQLILNNNLSNDIVLYSVPAIDITEDVVKALNERYASKK